MFVYEKKLRIKDNFRWRFVDGKSEWSISVAEAMYILINTKYDSKKKKD